MTKRARPVSPFMLGQVYRFQITSVMSLLHRVSGVILSFGAFGVAWWLLAVAQGGDAYAQVAGVMASWPGKVVLFGFSMALIYHLLNGIRHLLQDGGMGFSIPQFVRSSLISMIGSVLLTAIVWGVFLVRWGQA